MKRKQPTTKAPSGLTEPKPPSEVPPFLKPQGNRVLLAVKVIPRSSKSEVCGQLGDELKIKISAPPVDSAANDELLRFLASLLHCPKSSVGLVRGATSRHKVIAIDGVPLAVVQSAVQPKG